MNLIDEYVEIVSKYIDSPEIFIKATGCWLISATLGRFVKIPHLPQKYPRPNLYVALASPPLFMRRSTLATIAKSIYRKAYARFLKEEPDSQTYKEINERFIEEFTIEGICDHIEATGHEDYVLYSNEFGMVLKRTKSKHLAGMLSVMSKLHDGLPHTQTLSQRGGKTGTRYIPEGLYVTMLVEMQEPKQYLDKLMLSQGFLRRLILFPQKYEDIDLHRYKPLLSVERLGMWRDFEKFSVEVSNRMKEISNFVKLNEKEIEIEFSSTDIIDYINKYDKDLRRYAKSSKDPKSIYYGALPIFLTKLCVIYALADVDNKPVEIAGEYKINVSERHLTSASKIIKDILSRIKEVLEEIVLEEKEEPIKSQINVFEKIKQIIGERGINMSKLMQRLNIKKSELKPILETMFERDELFVVKHRTSGRPAIVVFTNRKVAERYKTLNKGLSSELYDASNYKDFLETW